MKHYLNTQIVAFYATITILGCLGLLCVYNGNAGLLNTLIAATPDIHVNIVFILTIILVSAILICEIALTELFLQGNKKWYIALAILICVFGLGILDWQGGQIKGEENSQKTEIAAINKTFSIENSQRNALLGQSKADSLQLVSQIHRLGSELTNQMDSVLILRSASEKTLQEIDYLNKANNQAAVRGEKQNKSYANFLQEKSTKIRNLISEKNELVTSLQRKIKIAKENLESTQSEIRNANIAVLNGLVSNNNLVATKIKSAQMWGGIRAILTSLLTVFFTFLAHKLHEGLPKVDKVIIKEVAKKQTEIALAISDNLKQAAFLKDYSKDLNRLARFSNDVIKAFETVYFSTEANKTKHGFSVCPDGLFPNLSSFKNAYQTQKSHVGYSFLKDESTMVGLNLETVLAEIRNNQNLIS